MNAYAGQVQLRPANDSEHMEIEKQLMGYAKILAVTMVCIFIIFVVVVGLDLADMLENGCGAMRVIFVAIELIFLMVTCDCLLKDGLEPLFRIPKWQYLVVDCIVMEKEKRSGSRGSSYYAMVSFADGTSRKVKVNTIQIYENARIGCHAVVIWILDGKGNPRKQPYSLSLV